LIAHERLALRSPLRADAAASTASPPAFVTIAIRASCRERTGRAGSADLPDGLSGIFFSKGLDRFLLICPSGTKRAPTMHVAVAKPISAPLKCLFEPIRCRPLKGIGMRRREFITLLGGTAAWPIATRAEQPARLSTIGFLGLFTPMNEWVAAFVQRLSELRWVVGNTVTIEYRSAEGRNDRLAEFAAEFVRATANHARWPGGSRSRRSDILWAGLSRAMATVCGIHRQDIARGQAR
jgi:hypothetical protein